MGQLRWLRNPKKSWSVLLTVTSLITSILGGLSPDPVDEAASEREILFDALTLHLSGDGIEYHPGAVAYTLWGIKPSEPALAQVNLSWQDLPDTTLEASWVLATYDGDGEESYVTGESIRDLAGKGDHTLQIPLHQANDADLQTLAIEISIQQGDVVDIYHQLTTFVSGLTAHDMRRAASDYFGQDPFVGLDGTASFCKAGVDPFVEGTQWDDSSGLALVYSYLPADCQLFVEHGAQALFLAGSQQTFDPCAVLDGVDLNAPCIVNPPDVDPCQAVDRYQLPGCGGPIPCFDEDDWQITTSGSEDARVVSEICGFPVPDPCDPVLLSGLPGCGGPIPCTNDDQEMQAQQSQNDPWSDVEIIELPGQVCGVPVPHPCDTLGDDGRLKEPLPGCGGSIPCTSDDQEMQNQQSQNDPWSDVEIIELPGQVCGVPVPHPCDTLGDDGKLDEPLPGCGGPIPCTGSGDESGSSEPSFAEIDPGLIIPDEVCGVPLGLCPMLSYLGMADPVFCQDEYWDGFGECESCNGLAQQVDDALEDYVLPTVVPVLRDTKQALGGGRWSISLMQESLSALTPYDGDPGPVAAVGSLSIDVPDSGSIFQDTNVISGQWKLDDQIASERGASNAEKWLWSAGCGAAVVATGVAVFFTAGLAAIAGFGLAAASACTAAGLAWADTGYMACGIEPWGVSWGPQNIVSNLLGIDAGSSGAATTTVYFDGDGNPTDSGNYILIYNANGYDKGRAACVAADKASEEAARAAANEYGSTAGGGSASIDLIIELPIQLWDVDLIYDLGGDLLFSPTQGLAVACDGGACPTSIGLSVSQCGSVTVKGGTPAEVTYLFQGGPHEDELCPLNVNVHIGDDDESIGVPALALSVQYEGAGQ